MTKILLVEDDKSLREIYGVRLLAEGYDIVSAGDGEEALAMVVKEMPDLILSDVMMPRVSGFDMLDILRANPPTRGIKVIMMTALSSEDQRQRGEQLGANKYLVKSQVGIEDVVKAVHEVLGDLNQPIETVKDNSNSSVKQAQTVSQPLNPAPGVNLVNTRENTPNYQPHQQFRNPPTFARETPSLQQPVERSGSINVGLQPRGIIQESIDIQPQSSATQLSNDNQIGNMTTIPQSSTQPYTESPSAVSKKVVQSSSRISEFETQEAQFAAELDNVLRNVNSQAEIPTQPEQPHFGAR